MFKTNQIKEVSLNANMLDIPEDKYIRLLDRWKVYQLRNNSSLFRKFLLFLTLVGPGILVMIADNDAGGVITYAQTGAQYGIGFFIPFLILMIPVAYIVQEMTVRLGAVTKRGHAEMIWKRYGKFWGAFSLFDLVVANILTLITEFIGMATGLKVFGVPAWLSVIGGFVVVSSVLIFLKYYTWERIALWIAAGNLFFVPLVILAHPDWSKVISSFATWHIPHGSSFSTFIYIILANLGTTIAPWMLFFQQSSVVDKGLAKIDIPQGQLDTFIGSVIMGIVAISIVILTGSLVFGLPGASGFDINHIMFVLSKSRIGQIGTDLFALGLAEAGLIAAIAITASTSWATGEALDLERSINSRFSKALPFYLSGILSSALAATVVLIPHMPLGLLNLAVQVIATIFMPAAMLFLLMLLNDKEIMGDYVNKPWQNIAAFTIVGILIIANMLYGYTVMFHK
ncbi:NRAMP family divalent metal transporter [Desulfurella sp.]|uniref:NRAMP family divalent metal transporter n=1 Tax=Desulfurella sp. TaxID=1962857 RepID=UPI0025BAD5EF|nr:NRAMP family divalent metal transporter [Desulfurella sp.]